MTTDVLVTISESVTSVTSSLLERARRRDGNAWERLVAIYGPLVYYWCRQRGVSAEDAADIGQEVFQVLSQKLVTFRREGPSDSFRGWLRTIVHSRVVDFWRQQNRQPRGPGGTDVQEALHNVPAPESDSLPVQVDEEVQILYQQILKFVKDQFPESQWEAFVKVVLEEHSPAEVAYELRLTRNQVYLAKSRIIRCIREEFGVASGD